MKELELFHKNGFIIIPDVLTSEQCDILKRDIDSRTTSLKDAFKNKNVAVYHKMFEQSDAHRDLFFQQPTVDIAKAIIRDPVIRDLGGSEYENDFTYDTSLECHVVHNSAILVKSNTQGINTWHQDDPPHYLVKDGNIPTNVHLPCLLLTANYYLTDVTSIKNGPTVFIPGSHLFGKPCSSSLDESQYQLHHCLASKGSVLIFNCQIWHRGSPNTSDVNRYVSQVSYARRMVGHKYYPFMNYKMPEYVIENMTDSQKLLAGFLSHGSYG